MKRQVEETKNLGDFEVGKKCVQKKGVEDWRSLFKEGAGVLGASQG
jgi:hypothetical protein